MAEQEELLTQILEELKRIRAEISDIQVEVNGIRHGEYEKLDPKGGPGMGHFI